MVNQKKGKKKYEDEKVDEKLNVRQELFCQLYATRQEFFGNGVESYAEAYDIDKGNPNWFAVSAASASRLLKNVKIIARIQQIMVETGFNDAHADRELSFLMTQHADLSVKLGAVKEFNKLKNRIEDKIDITSKGERLVNVNLISYVSSSETNGNNDTKQLQTAPLPDPLPNRSGESNAGIV